MLVCCLWKWAGLRSCVRFHHLHRCAEWTLSWPALHQVEQPERCTWPYARYDPSCSESTGAEREVTFTKVVNSSRSIADRIAQAVTWKHCHALTLIASDGNGKLPTSAENLKCICVHKERQAAMTDFNCLLEIATRGKWLHMMYLTQQKEKDPESKNREERESVLSCVIDAEWHSANKVNVRRHWTD